MNAILGIGKYLYALVMLGFGANHFMAADAMAGYAPFGGTTMVYITGVCLILAAISILIGKMDKLATALLGVLLLIIAFSIHYPAMGAAGEDQAAAGAAMANMMKDIGLAGAAWMYSASMARDNAVIG